MLWVADKVITSSNTTSIGAFTATSFALFVGLLDTNTGASWTSKLLLFEHASEKNNR
jgi:hypothetical protein